MTSSESQEVENCKKNYLPLMTGNGKTKLESNISKLNGIIDEIYTQYGKNPEKIVEILSIADNPSELTDENFKLKVIEKTERYVKQLGDISDKISQGKTDEAAEKLNDFLLNNEPYTTDESLFLCKLREENPERFTSNLGIRLQNGKYNDLKGNPEKQQVFFSYLEEYAGRGKIADGNILKNIMTRAGFSEEQIKKAVPENMCCDLVVAKPDTFKTVNWEDVENRVYQYFACTESNFDNLENENQFKYLKFKKEYSNVFVDGKLDKDQFINNLLKPIEKCVPTKEGFKKLPDEIKEFCKTYLEKNFCINSYFTGYSISATLDKGIGGSGERVLETGNNEYGLTHAGFSNLILDQKSGDTRTPEELFDSRIVASVRINFNKDGMFNEVTSEDILYPREEIEKSSQIVKDILPEVKEKIRSMENGEIILKKINDCVDIMPAEEKVHGNRLYRNLNLLAEKDGNLEKALNYFENDLEKNVYWMSRASDPECFLSDKERNIPLQRTGNKLSKETEEVLMKIVPEEEQKQLFEHLAVYSGSKDNKVIDNLNKLNENELKSCLEFLPGTAADNLKWLGIVDNPKSVINPKFQEDVIEESKNRNEKIMKFIQNEDKVVNLSESMMSILDYDKTAYTPEQNIILLKYRSSEEVKIEPVYVKVIANNGGDTLDKNGSREVAVIPLEDFMGKGGSVLKDNFGITSENKSEYSLCVIGVEKGAAVRRSSDQIKEKLVDYYKEMKQKDPDQFSADSERYGFENTEKWEESFIDKVYEPIRNHVPTNAGYFMLSERLQNFQNDVMDNKFGIDRYNTFCGFSANLGQGKGGITECVIEVDKNKRIPCTEKSLKIYSGKINKDVKNCVSYKIEDSDKYSIMNVFLFPDIPEKLVTAPEVKKENENLKTPKVRKLEDNSIEIGK